MTLKHYNPKLNKLLPCRAKSPNSCRYMHFENEKEGRQYVDNINEYKVTNNIPFETNIEEHYNELKKLSEENTESADKVRTECAKVNSLLNNNKTTTQVNYDNLFNDIKEPDGGATFNPYTNESPVCGFCYSPFPERSKVVDADKLTKEDLDKYAEDNKDLLQKKNHYVGIWNDPTTNIVYLDISINSQDAEESREQCKQKDQIAYFDLQTFNSVTVDQNATSGQS